MLTLGRVLRARLLVVVGFTLASAACGGDSPAGSPLAPSAVATVTAASPPAGSSPSAADDLAAVLTLALQDEFHAQAVYQGVLADFGQVLPFANIVTAEGRHAQSIAQLLAVRGLNVPASAWTVANVPHFASAREACGVAAVAEIENIALYDRYLVLDLPADVRTVFSNNRLASLNGHLPAFNNCK